MSNGKMVPLLCAILLSVQFIALEAFSKNVEEKHGDLERDNFRLVIDNPDQLNIDDGAGTYPRQIIDMYDHGVCNKTGYKYRHKTAVLKVLFFVTMSMAEKVRNEGYDPEFYVRTLVDTLNRRYYSRIACPKIQIKVAGIVVSRSKNDEYFIKPRIPCKVDFLEDFAKYVKNWSDGTGTRVGAGYVLYRCGGGGLAFLDASCNPYYYAGFGDYDLPYAARIMVHELGHILGADHDGEGTAENCYPNKDIMGGNAKDTFSECSLLDFVKTFQKDHVSCLFEDS